MPNPTTENPKIKYIKKAQLWVKTWFEEDAKGKPIQKQEWASTKQELEV